MHRSLLLPTAVTSLLPMLISCVHPGPPLAAAPPPSAPDPALAVSYRMLRVGDGDGVLLSGNTLVDWKLGTRVKSASPHGASSQSLELDARHAGDGTVVLQVMYDESTADGAHLDWRPALRLGRGTTTRVAMTGGGWGRVLEISID
jgi:hypothetical protein